MLKVTSSKSGEPTIFLDSNYKIIDHNPEFLRLFQTMDLPSSSLTYEADFFNLSIMNHISKLKLQSEITKVFTSGHLGTCNNIPLITKLGMIVDFFIRPIYSTNQAIAYVQLILYEKKLSYDLPHPMDLFLNAHKLDQRLKPVFELILEDKSNMEMAHLLQLSKTTVQNYISAIYASLVEEGHKNNEKRGRVIDLYNTFRMEC